MLEDYDTGEKDDQGNAKMSTRLWDANALEKVDDHTVRLNLKEAQVAVPEHFFHYPFAILDPEEGGKFGPGSNGTGPYPTDLNKASARQAVLRRRDGWWGGESFLDEVDLHRPRRRPVRNRRRHRLAAGARPVQRRCRHQHPRHSQEPPARQRPAR